MSDKDRRKKDGRDPNKDRQAMREDVKERHEKASREVVNEGRGGDEGARMIDYKPGSASDRNTQNRAT